MKVGLAGETLAYRDFPLTLYRHGGKPEQVWLNLDYSPVLGEDGRPAGVMAIVVEITDKVRIERELEAERKSLKRMFEQAPGFIAMAERTRASFHHGERGLSDAGRRSRCGRAGPWPRRFRRWSSRASWDCSIGFMLPASPMSGAARPSICSTVRTAPSTERYLDFIYQPIVADDGATTGIFIRATTSPSSTRRNTRSARNPESSTY